ncbi:MAG: hypothetical protein GTO40_01890 [Deltaproteobacteria bacterium]|nr:hypothetical protein [Deltaproteobacteria bacterium]
MSFKHCVSIFTGVFIAMGSVTVPSTTHAQHYFEDKTITMILGSAPRGPQGSYLKNHRQVLD